MKSKLNYLFLYFILLTNAVNSQEQEGDKADNQQPLIEVLKTLEAKHDVRFSFNSALIEELYVLSPGSENDLKLTLTYLEKETHLVFELLDDRYIVVKKKEVTKNNKICGFLVDKITGAPIANATIWVEKESIGVSSNLQGYFEFQGLHSNWEVRIDYLGYYSLSSTVFKMLNVPCQKIPLSEISEVLDEVLVRDYLTNGMTKKKDGAVQVTPNKLGILPGLTEPDVLQSLQMLPGVQSPNETASGLYVRGGTPDQNLVFFDGIKMYESGHFFGLISSFNPYITDKINFYRSGTSAIYGGRIGSVLDITSGDSVPDFSAGFGLNLLHSDAYIKTPLFKNKIGVFLSGRRSLTDKWKTVTYKSFSESVFQNTRVLEEGTEGVNRATNIDNNFFFQDYNLKVIAEISKKDQLVFSNLKNKNDLSYFSETERFGEERSDNLSVKNKGSSLNWSKTWSDTWTHKIEFSNSEYVLDYDGKTEIIRKDPSKSRSDVFEKYNLVKDIEVRLNSIHKVSAVSSWSYGYQYSKNNVEYFFSKSGRTGGGNELLESAKTVNSTNALYAEYSMNKDEKWNLNVGFRVNTFSKIPKVVYLEPRLFLSNQVSESFQVNFSAEIKNQVLSKLIEFRNSGLGLENEIWALSDNDKIPVLQSSQITAGFLFKKKGWHLDLDIYAKTIEGLTIFAEDIETRPEYLSGKSKTKGMDFLVKRKFGNYRTWISYTLSETKFFYKELNSGNQFDGEYDIPHSLVWSHTYLMNSWEFSLGWKIRSGTPYTKGIDLNQAPNGNYRVVYEDQVNSKRLPNYKKVDMSATYKFKFTNSGNVRGKFGVSLMNVFNTKNILDRSYEVKTEKKISNSETPQLVETDQISIGFTPNLVFRVEF